MTKDEENLIECVSTIDNSVYYRTLMHIINERDEYALLLFQPCGETHHDANKCPFCKEYLNGRT